MKVLVTADTHGRISSLQQAIKQAGEFEVFVHLGDNASDVKFLLPELEARGVKVYQVLGNCDYSGAESYVELMLCGQRICLTHGHKQRVKYSMLGLSLLAAEKEAAAVLYGHTHQPRVEYASNGALLFNPGSLGEPRGVSGRTFGILTVTKEGVFPKVVQLEEP